jgi:hypothetical protein
LSREREREQNIILPKHHAHYTTSVLYVFCYFVVVVAVVRKEKKSQRGEEALFFCVEVSARVCWKYPYK